MNRYDLQALARMRLSDAEALLLTYQNDAGAYYLAGYAIECALKACIAKNQGLYPFPLRLRERDLQNYYTHDVQVLLETADLKTALQADMRTNSSLQSNWGIVIAWNESTRYNPLVLRREAEDLINAVNDPVDGVLRWLENHW